MTDPRDVQTLVASRIVEALFRNGFGDEANRLVLEGTGGRNLGGRCKTAVRDVIVRIFKDVLTAELIAMSPSATNTPAADRTVNSVISQCRADYGGLVADNTRLTAALRNVRAHTGHPPGADYDLLAGLLASVERIADAALAAEDAQPVELWWRLLRGWLQERAQFPAERESQTFTPLHVLGEMDRLEREG